MQGGGGHAGNEQVSAGKGVEGSGKRVCVCPAPAALPELSAELAVVTRRAPPGQAEGPGERRPNDQLNT